MDITITFIFMFIIAAVVGGFLGGIIMLFITEPFEEVVDFLKYVFSFGRLS